MKYKGYASNLSTENGISTIWVHQWKPTNWNSRVFKNIEKFEKNFIFQDMEPSGGLIFIIVLGS